MMSATPMPTSVTWISQRLRLAACIGCLCTGIATLGQDAKREWSERESRLANEYLSQLVSQPEYGRMVDLLWDLYEKHQSTALLLDNVSTQAQATKHPAALLVQGHLVRKSGDLRAAASLYDTVLAGEPRHPAALRARADVARELNDLPTAATMLRRWTEQMADSDDRKPQAWLELGTVSLGAGQTKEAVAAWEQAAKLKPGNFDLARQVAELLLRAGFPERAAAFYATLTEQPDPGQRLSAYFDLARIHEHADQFERADAALQQGLALLDFRDARYSEFFRRRVRLHERFGGLDELRQQLLTQAERKPPAEQALRDLVRFYEVTVDLDEHLRWLRELVKVAPQTDEYRWELVRALLDHEGAAEAARLLDERMKGDGTDLPAIVFLRCEADLRQGEAAAATARLKKLMTAQGGSLEVEKQALNFAQTRALDAVIEMILQARVERDPAKAEAVFELAGFYRARKDMATADAVLRRFTATAGSEAERQQRLNDAAAFLAAGQDLGSAIAAARQAAKVPGAGREETLRLADLLAEHGDHEEAVTLLEKAWQMSRTDEERVDVDERLFSVLMGSTGKDEYNAGKGIIGEFKLPDAFTGRGFASDSVTPPTREMPPGVIAKAKALFGSAMAGPGSTAIADGPDDASKANLAAGAQVSPGTPPEQIFRAAWWAVRSEMIGEAYKLLKALAIDPATGLVGELPLEAEKLLLDLTYTDGNKGLALRSLDRLMQKDPANKVRYVMRKSELLMEAEQTAASVTQNNRWKSEGTQPPPAQAATKLLEDAYREAPDSEALLSALTQCYTLQRRNEDALKIWKGAVERAPAGMATSLRERYAELLLRQQKLDEYVQAQVAIVESETDVKRRREIFKRFLDRLLWTEQGGELPPETKTSRLELVSKALGDPLRRHPFDGFYPEAQALVYERLGDAGKAFAMMKQAYYTAPETPFSLAQLRDAALGVADLESAIYFQKQIAAAAPAGELAGESRRLVELLEETFQIAEADRVRRRLESRFSQNAAALEDLAEHYKTTGQDEAERRVYEQVARVRPWDAASQLRIALKCLRLADEAAAARHLREILDKTAGKAATAKATTADRPPLPVADLRKPGAAGPVTEVTSLLDTAAGIEREEINRIRGFLTLPRPEFMQLPETMPLVRLRAIEELARLTQQHGADATAAWTREWQQNGKAHAIEKLWALYYGGAGAEFRVQLHSMLGEKTDLENQFCFAWLTLRSQGMEQALTWAGQTGLSPQIMETRKRLLLAAVSMLADLDGFRFEKGQLTALGATKVLRDPPLRDITRRLQDQQRYAEALELGESLRRNPLSPIDDFFLGRIAEAAERWDLARQYLGAVVKAPIQPGNFRGTYDPFLLSLSTTTRLANSAQDREETLRQAWQHLQKMPRSGLTDLHRSAVIGLAGAADPAAKELTELITGDFLAARTIDKTNGTLLPQGSTRSEEPLHLHGLWEETREIQATFVQQGLGQVVQATNGKLAERWGSIGLSSRTGLEFGEWRLTNLLRQLRQSNYPTRLRLIREYLASVDMRMEVSVETLGELGSRLETAGMPREAIEVYGLLPSRAPANPDYALWLIRACEAAMETKRGIQFTLQLLNAEPPMKPPQPGDEILRDKHAAFLAMDFQLDELKRLGFAKPFSSVRQGRIPHEAPYLRELALLHERLGQDDQALAAWDRIHEVYAFNAESDITPEPESSLHRGRILRKQGKIAAAQQALREIPLEDASGASGLEALKLRAELATETEGWEEFRELMSVAVERKSLDVISHLTELLRVKGRSAEALNFLTQAERSLKEESGRFLLRLELLKLMAHDAAWTPERGRSHVAALFRARSRDRETLKRLLTWMQDQATGRHEAAWRGLLRAEARAGTDRPVAALALCAFAGAMPESAEEDLTQGWKAAAEGDRICLELGAAALLTASKPRWAWQACLAMKDLPNMRLEGRNLPLMVTVAHAMGDRMIVRELFADVIRMPFPGGNRTEEWVKAFVDAGEEGLARELFSAALDRLAATETVHPELYSAWIQFLVQRREHEAAETFLMRQQWALPHASAKLIFELYQSWGKLASLSAELPKFHLPSGIEKEVLFLASQALGLPPPLTPAPKP